MKHIFIINPTAGKSDSRQNIYDMADELRHRHGLDVHCILTKSRATPRSWPKSCAKAARICAFTPAAATAR